MSCLPGERVVMFFCKQALSVSCSRGEQLVNCELESGQKLRQLLPSDACASIDLTLSQLTDKFASLCGDVNRAVDTLTDRQSSSAQYQKCTADMRQWLTETMIVSLALEHHWPFSFLGLFSTLGLFTQLPWPFQHPWPFNIFGLRTSLAFQYPRPFSILGLSACLAFQHPWPFNILGLSASLAFQDPFLVSPVPTGLVHFMTTLHRTLVARISLKCQLLTKF